MHRFSVISIIKQYFYIIIILICYSLISVCGKEGRIPNYPIIFGFKTKDSVVLSASKNLVANGLKLRSEYSWIRRFGKNTLIAISGDPTISELLFEVISKEYLLNDLRFRRENGNDTPVMTTQKLAMFCRGLLCQSLPRNPLDVRIIVAGVDGSTDGLGKRKPILYWIDSYGNLKSAEYASFGGTFEFAFLLSLLDQQNEELKKKNGKGFVGIDDDNEMARKIIEKCWNVIQSRSSQEIHNSFSIETMSCLESTSSSINRFPFLL